MPYQPNLSYSVTRIEAPTLNNAGDSRENPIIRGAVLEIRVHKWHKDVRLKKAWTTVPDLQPGVFFDFTDHVMTPFSDAITQYSWNNSTPEQRAAVLNSGLPSYMTYNPEGIVGEMSLGYPVVTIDEARQSHGYSVEDAEKYIAFRIMLGSDVFFGNEVLEDVILGEFPNITAHGDPPIRTIFHITTTNGSHTPITYRHRESLEGTTDYPTGLVYERSSQDRPGGQQLKFSLWVSREILGEILLDGYAAADPRYPLIYPVFVTGEDPEEPEAGDIVEDELGELSQRAKTKLRLRRGDPMSKKAYGKFKRTYTEPEDATNTLEMPPPIDE